MIYIVLSIFTDAKRGGIDHVIRYLKKTVELTVDDKVLKFSSVEEFEFALNPRTTVPFDRVSKIMSLPIEELSNELKAIAVAKDEVNKLMSHSPETSAEVSARLKAAQSVSFSKEHNWREIFVGLKKSDCARTHPYKNTALKMYLRYLTNRTDIIKYIKKEISFKKDLVGENDDNILSSTIAPVQSSLSTIESNADSLRTDVNMERMIKGDAIVIEIEEGESVFLRLADYIVVN